VPDAEVKAVVALADRSGTLAPIFEVVTAFRRAVFVISQSGMRSILEAAPSFAITVVKFGGVAVFVG
jgi:hypothetical protein